MRKLSFFLLCLVTAVLSQVALAQNINVSGTVTDASSGEGVPFASIQVKGTMTGTATDADGNYTISVPKNAILVFSSIGYINQEVAVDGRTIVNVMLAPDAESLAHGLAGDIRAVLPDKLRENLFLHLPHLGSIVLFPPRIVNLFFTALTFQRVYCKLFLEFRLQ